MKIFYITIISISFLVSCNDNKNGDLSPEIVKSETTSIDSILYRIEVELEEKTKLYKDSLLLSINLNTIPEIDYTKGRETFKSFQKAIKEKDTLKYSDNFQIVPPSRYYNINLRNIEPINYAPYALYMADSVKYAPAYKDVFDSFIQLNYCYANMISDKNFEFIRLSFLNDKQRDLAILYLIKSYNMGSASSALALSIYFQLGIYYFPKDLQKSKVLDLLSYQRSR